MKIEHTFNHVEKRQQEYPSIGDVLDAILSDLDPALLGEKGKAMLALRQAIKAKYPKSTTTT